MFEWIDTPEHLESHVALLLAAAQQGPVAVALDTEFIREHTYFSQLCLIQMAWNEHVVLIDPLALVGALGPLKEVLTHPQITKIFHSARQDLEIFWLLFQVVPAPLYDTQIAAMVCGYGESIAYTLLVEHILGLSLDKASRLTDWSKRPLNREQCAYAVGDVTHLLKIYGHLQARLREAGRTLWIEGETEALLNPALYEPNPEAAWLKIRANRLKPRSLEALKLLAAFRERQAIEKNIPKTRFMKDEVLVELSTHLPDTLDQLKGMRSLPPGMRTNPVMGEMMKLIAQSKKNPTPGSSKNFVQEKIFPSKYEGLLDLLRMLLKIVCDQEGVAPKLVGGRQELEQLIIHTLEGQSAALEDSLLQGWRFDLFGQKAQKLILGQEGLFWREGKILSLGGK